ncbi:MAG: peptide transporter substrate-binding protein [Brevibacillus sp.]|nr:peptide transporter substrate-binding protein [Brevibacillus sp.]
MSKKMGRFGRWGIPLVSAAFLLAACSSQSSTTGQEMQSQPTKSSIGKPGGAFTVSTVIEVDTVDFERSSWVDIANYAMYDPLLNYDDKGKIIPGIAESYSISPDGKVWTFQLKKGVKFHSGEPLTAEAIKLSIERFQSISPVKALTGPMEKVEATDQETVKIYFTEPYAPFITMVTNPFFGPMDPTRVQELGDKFENNPSSTGPFMFVKHDRGASISYKKNPDYNWGSPYLSNTGAPHIDKLVFKFTKDDDTRILEFKKGDVQMLQGVPNNYVKELESIPGVVITKQLEAGMKYLGFNHKKPEFQDVRLRKALAMAVDRDPIIQVALAGFGQPVYSPLPKTIFGHSEKVEEQAKQMYVRDVNKAKSLLAEAGWTDSNGDGIADKAGKPLSIELLMPHNPILERSAQILQSQFKEIGVDLKLTVNDIATVKDRMSKAFFDMYLLYYGYTDPEILYLLLHSQMSTRLHYSNPKIDELLVKGRQTMNQEERAKIYEEAQGILVNDVPLIPLFSEETILATRDVEGLKINPFSQLIFLQDVNWK